MTTPIESPISIEKLKSVKKIIVHGDLCADGRGSALILAQVYPNVPIQFVGYNTLDHINMVPEEGLLFCDFSPHKDNWEAFLEAGTIVLDHHEGISEAVKKFQAKGLGIYAHNKDAAWANYSGAMLAYHFAALPLLKNDSNLGALNDIANLCGIRDTWRKDSDLWVPACETTMAISNLPESYVLDQKTSIQDKLSFFKFLGKFQYEKQLDAAKHTLSKAYHFTSEKGTKVCLFSGTGLSSDVAEIADADLVIGYSLAATEANSDGTQNITLTLSTRTRKSFPCMCLAQYFGGNGHPSAAGCKITGKIGDLEPYSKIMSMVNEFEVFFEDTKNMCNSVLGGMTLNLSFSDGGANADPKRQLEVVRSTVSIAKMCRVAYDVDEEKLFVRLYKPTE